MRNSSDMAILCNGSVSLFLKNEKSSLFRKLNNEKNRIPIACVNYADSSVPNEVKILKVEFARCETIAKSSKYSYMGTILTRLVNQYSIDSSARLGW